MNVTEMISAARATIRNLTVDELAAELENSEVVLVDVREPEELAAEGMIPGAIAAPRGMLEFHADSSSPYHLDALRTDRPVIVYCKSGGRSALAAATLAAMGYRDAAHLDGGITAWKQAQRPTVHATHRGKP
jgi:rhodanese-related sulfurtransferase